MIIVSSNIDKEQSIGRYGWLFTFDIYDKQSEYTTRRTSYREQLKIVMRLVIFFSGSNQWKFDVGSVALLLHFAKCENRKYENKKCIFLLHFSTI